MVAPRAGRCRNMRAAGQAAKSPGSRASATTDAWAFAPGCSVVAGAAGFRGSTDDPVSVPLVFCAVAFGAVGSVTSASPWTCPKTARDCGSAMESIGGQKASQHLDSRGSRAVPGGTKGATAAGSCQRGSARVADGSESSSHGGALRGSGYGPRDRKSPCRTASLAFSARSFPPWLPSLC